MTSQPNLNDQSINDWAKETEKHIMAQQNVQPQNVQNVQNVQPQQVQPYNPPKTNKYNAMRPIQQKQNFQQQKPQSQYQDPQIRMDQFENKKVLELSNKDLVNILILRSDLDIFLNILSNLIE